MPTTTLLETRPPDNDAATSPELARLRRENEQLRSLYEKSLGDVARLREQLQWFLKQTFGAKRERIDAVTLQKAWNAYLASKEGTSESMAPEASSLAMQLLLQMVGEADAAAKTPSTSNDAPPSPPSPPPSELKKRTRHAHGRAPLPAHLPTERVVLRPQGLPEGARRVGEEVSERWAYRKASYVRLLVVRETYAIDHDDGRSCFVLADTPDEMIARGACDPAMLAHVIQSKWGDHLPWHRLAGILERQGAAIAATTLAGWAERAEPLARAVVDAMRVDARANAATIAIDATTAAVQAKGQCKRGYPWVMVADRTHVLFGFSQRHTQDIPKEMLRGFRGYVLADASSVYDRLFEGDDAPTEAGCMAHCRRRFFFAAESDPRALVGLKLTDTLFAIERDIASRPPVERRAVRLERSTPVLAELRAWRDRLLEDASVDPQGRLAKALRYSRNHWDALCRFLDDGRIPISNNGAEREIRAIAVGRKNWLFFGSEEHAEIACTWLSLIASAKLHKLDPEAYLRDLFRVLPSWPKSRVVELAPARWSNTRARLDPNALAEPLGPIVIPSVDGGE